MLLGSIRAQGGGCRQLHKSTTDKNSHTWAVVLPQGKPDDGVCVCVCVCLFARKKCLRLKETVLFESYSDFHNLLKKMQSVDQSNENVNNSTMWCVCAAEQNLGQWFFVSSTELTDWPMLC